MVSGAVGVDKCLQALSVANLEVVSTSAGALKAVCSVRKVPVSVQHTGKGGWAPLSYLQRSQKDQDGVGWRSAPLSPPLQRSQKDQDGVGWRSAPSNRAGQAVGKTTERLRTRSGPRTGFIFEVWLCSLEEYDHL